METKFSQVDFSGGLNVNSLIAENELQEALNVDIETFGRLRPAHADTLIKSITGVKNIAVADGYIYYNVDDTLYRAKGTVTQTMGTVGRGFFDVHKDGDIHIIRASDKMYKVIGTTLTALGTAGPSTAPTLALEAQKTLQIATFEDHTAWTGDGSITKSDDAVNVKQGTNSMKLVASTASAIEYVTKATVIDLTAYADGTVSEDDDIISFWIYLSDPSKYTYSEIVFDINTGDFKNDMFSKVMPILPNQSDQSLNEDIPESFADPLKIIAWTDAYDSWDDKFSSQDRDEFDKNYLGGDSTSKAIQVKQTRKKVNKAYGQPAWTNIKIRKSEFVRIGGNISKDWSTVQAIKLIIYVNDVLLEVSFDDMQLIGGGKLDNNRFKVSYSYVTKATLDDGTAYEEESQISPEAEVLSPERQNIIITGIADSSDSQVTHKRIYIRGGGIIRRHKVGEIVTGTTTFTTDKSEENIVIQLPEDARKNGVAPTSPVSSEIVNGRLYISNGRTVYFSRSLKLYAFKDNDNVVLPYEVKAMYEKGPNLAVLMTNHEKIYTNPGFTAAQGGYFHKVKNPLGCIATRSASDSYHLSSEGIVFFLGQNPTVISGKIRDELLSYSTESLEGAVGAYLKGRYYLCIPNESIMYEFDSNIGRFTKHDGIIDIAAGDDGLLYILKSDGIYSFQTDKTKRKSFSMRTYEIQTPGENAFRQIVIDVDLGSEVDTTVEYYLNNTAKTSKVITTSGRQKKIIPITQEAGARYSVKISTSGETTNTDMSIYGVYLQ